MDVNRGIPGRMRELFGVTCLWVGLWVTLSIAAVAHAEDSRPSAEGSLAPKPIGVSATSAAIQRAAQPIRGAADDYDALMQRVGNARVVMLGEDTHGSLEFYRERARITMRLIEEKGFNGVVIESDWAPSERVNRYVRGEAGDESAEIALSGHTRFPDWMWRNVPFHDLVEWLRAYNQTVGGGARPVGVYGMDAQGMASSANGLLATLARVDPSDAARVREHYACLARFDFDSDRYGKALQNPEAVSCEPGAADAFAALQARAATEADANVGANDAEWFSVMQNAQAMRAAEAYSRAQVTPGANSWNVRDLHMAEVIDAVLKRLDSQGGAPAKVVVWAHNTHVGDARASDRGVRGGYWSVGQLIRERHADETVLVGFTTRLGLVRAAPAWGEADRVYNLRRPAWESVPAIFGRVRRPRFLLVFADVGAQLSALDDNVPLRAIGAVYAPKVERSEHYYRVRLTSLFDAIVHIDQTRALPRQ